MADEEKNGGYTKMPNALLETLAKKNMNGTQRRILDVVIRNTLGFSRKKHKISLVFLANATDKDKTQIKRELKKLIDLGVLIEHSKPGFTKARELGINDQYEQWGQVSTLEADTPKLQGGDSPTPQGMKIPTKKENIKEKNKESAVPVFEVLWEQYPVKKGKGKVDPRQKEVIERLGLEKMQGTFDRYLAGVKSDRDNGFPKLRYQNGDTFFNTGYLDYLEPSEIGQEEKMVPPIRESVQMTGKDIENFSEQKRQDELKNREEQRKIYGKEM